MNAHQMGAVLLEQARDAGARTLIPASLLEVHCNGAGAVDAVSIVCGEVSVSLSHFPFVTPHFPYI